MSRNRRFIDGQLPKPDEEAKKRQMIGKPTTFEVNDDLINKMRQAILIGAPVATAVALYNVPPSTFKDWCQKAVKQPHGKYAKMIEILKKAVAEWEVRDLEAWDAHIIGRPAKYLMQPKLDKSGQVMYDSDGKVVQEYVRNADGNLIIEHSEIKPDWRAAAERMARRKPRSWGHKLEIIEHDNLLETTIKDVTPEVADKPLSEQVEIVLAKIENEI